MPDPNAASPTLAEDERAIDAAIATRELLNQRTGVELLQLRRRRNNTIPNILRLPPEIVAEILTLFARDAQRADNPNRTSRLQWIQITHVCARWRSIARSLPKLWSVIYTMQDPLCTNMFLALSQKSLLSIVPALDACLKIMDVRFLAQLSHVMDRIQHMTLYLRWHSMLGPLRFFSEEAIEPRSALSLETLDLIYFTSRIYDKHRGYYIAEDPGPSSYFWFFSSKTPMPKLRTLRLRALPPSITVHLVRPTLTELRVSTASPLCLSMWLALLAKLPLLEVLHINGVEEDIQPIVPSVSPPDPDIVLGRISEIVVCVEECSLSDETGLCTRLLHRLIIPSSCMIQVPLAKDNPQSTIDVVLSKKDGRARLGEPQVFTSLQVGDGSACLWPEAGRGFEESEETSSVQLKGCGNALREIGRTSSFPHCNIQLICIHELSQHTNVRSLIPFTHLRELHFHLVLHDNWFKDLTLLPSTALPHLRSLTLELSDWCPRGDDPLSLIVDTLLSVRREAGAAIEELHLLMIRGSVDPEGILWLERMESSEMPTFTWTRWQPN
ncbi:hypothetical protein PHLGIDRAFT_207646 [Phlebiopsis gigantea 11061_1 CR5-6]|uniref:Uncharacterized protein n=1 Tax=Phlebiopsis gigantea (strain 11061_1 CR5-6) TaxID=745531 RepID=A0A0C3NH44_PHLG1|nr:hypothetical protein PHLGIDRAFT_207646 [Phlebiopsis gigantea 11061_1 CR5-6]